MPVYSLFYVQVWQVQWVRVRTRLPLLFIDKWEAVYILYSDNSNVEDPGDTNAVTGQSYRPKMEEKYSSNVLSGGKLGMVEVPNSRYVCEVNLVC